MVDLNLRFETFPNLLLFLLLTFVNSLWIYRNLKKKSGFSLKPFILINLLLFIAWGRLIHINGDESEHLHCAWMVSRGLVPFRDFWQHHSPFLWVILSPLFKIIKPTALIFEMSRIFSGLIFTLIALMGWKISSKVWQEKANLSVYLLVLSSVGVLGQFFYLRPDLFMDLFLLFGLYFSLEIPGKRLSPAFFAGISFAIAASFMFKQYLLYLLPIIIIFRERNKLRAGKFLIYLIGLAAGSLPLLFYLINKNILSEFISWVFKFNQQRIILWTVVFIAVGVMGAWGAYQLLSKYRKSKDIKSLILFIAFCMSTLSALTSTVVFSNSYYLGFWFVLCAIVSGGCNIVKMTEGAATLTKKSIILGLFFSLLIAPSFITLMTPRDNCFSNDKKVISKLMEYCGDDTCLVIVPLHPIFNYDATRLYLHWQYHDFANQFSSVRKDLRSKDIAGAIINLRPAVVLYKLKNSFFILQLYQKTLISKDDYGELASFMKENYTVKKLGEDDKHSYYIRNDKI